MPLDDLLETIETLRGRVHEHGPLLSQNEIRTRYALIDPLLRALGWDLDDPDQVVPEQDASGGRADYGLLDANKKLTVVVEAKRLDRPLKDGLNQSIAYCVGQGTPYFAVTDGRRWAVYETFRQVAVNEKLITEFDVLGDSPARVSLRALTLWRPSVTEGHVTDEVQPVVTPPKPETPAPEEQWVSLEDLAQLVPQKGSKPGPAELRFPTDEQVLATGWNSLRREVAKWLETKGHSVHTPSYHTNAANSLNNARKNVKQAGLDPADFKVRLAD